MHRIKSIYALLNDQSGATAIEYALIAALISIGIIAGATAVGSGLNSIFGSVSSAF